jgi:hypothetical protein
MTYNIHKFITKKTLSLHWQGLSCLRWIQTMSGMAAWLSELFYTMSVKTAGLGGPVDIKCAHMGPHLLLLWNKLNKAETIRHVLLCNDDCIVMKLVWQRPTLVTLAKIVDHQVLLKTDLQNPFWEWNYMNSAHHPHPWRTISGSSQRQS